jgi:agmatine/peptidylarginine deiminase
MHFYIGFNSVARWLVVAALVVSQLQIPFAKESIPSEERELIGQLVESLPEGFFTPRTVPNKSIPLQRLFPEWEPASIVLISVPVRVVSANPELMAFVLDFMRAVAQHVPIGVLYNREEEIYLGRFISRIEKDPALGELIDRIDFVESNVHGFWIRDHGPQFGLSVAGDLVLLDSIYRLLDSEAFYDPLDPPRTRFLDDLTPQFVGQYLRSDYQAESSVVRTPLHLHGGDFAADGLGNVFISEYTLLENGSDLETLELALRRYYGAESIHILNPPNGNTAKHLDLLFKIVSQGTYFLSLPPRASESSSSHERMLRRQMIRTYENNLKYLQRNLPQTKIVGLPMPSLLITSRSDRINRLKGEILNIVSLKAKVDLDIVMNGKKGTPQFDAAIDAIGLEMLLGTGVRIDLNNESDLDLAAQNYLGAGIDEYLETFVNPEAIHRSYTNSLIVTNTVNQTIILLPRFRPQDGESQEDYDGMEKQVEKAYLSEYPDARLHWIDSDEISKVGGSIHCMSVSVPLIRKLKNSRNKLKAG